MLKKYLLNQSIKRWSVCFICINIVMAPLNAANIVIDPSQSQTSLDVAINNVPIVNIAPPTNGLSQNKFKEYNVGNEGLIINNNLNTGESILGGYILENPNLESKMASSILFDVTGKNISKLEGLQEIFGQKAMFMLSNPNGLYINGAGFINTNRVRLSTGRPSWLNEQMQFDVDTGTITIGEQGLNGVEVNTVDLLAKSIDIQGNVFSKKNLNLISGTYRYDIESDTVTKYSDNDTTEVAIDISGSLKSGSISIISTEEGSGVASSGTLVSSVNDINISSSGELSVNNIYSSATLKLIAKSDMAVSGKQYANGSASYQSNESIQFNEAETLFNGNLNIAAKKIALESSSVDSLDNIQINTNHLDLTGKSNIRTTKKVDINANGMQNDGLIFGGRDVSIKAKQVENTDGRIIAEGNIDIEGLCNQGLNGAVTAGNKLSVGGDQLSVYGDLYAGRALNIDTKRTLFNYGTIMSDGGIQLGVGSRFENNNEVKAAESLSVDGDYLNNYSILYSGKEMALNLNREVNNKKNASILSGGDITIQSSRGNSLVIINSEAYIEALGSITIKANLLSNIGSYQISTNYHRITKPSLIDLGAKKGLYKKTQKVKNYYPTITVKKTISQHVKRQQHAIIQSGGTIRVINTNINNNIGTIVAKNIITEGSSIHNISVPYYNRYITYQAFANFMFTQKGCKTLICTGTRKNRYYYKDSRHHYFTTKYAGDISSTFSAEKAIVLSDKVYNIRDKLVNKVQLMESTYLNDIDTTFVNTEDYNVSDAIKKLQNRALLSSYRADIDVFDEPSTEMLIKGGGFMSKNDLLMSDYFYQRIAIKHPNAFVLGNEYVEQKYIEQMLDETLGQRLVYDNIRSQEDQINYWYNNAKHLEETFRVPVGVPLSDDVLSKLEKDVMWMEVVEFDNNQVIVPRLYLTKATKDRLLNEGKGALIAADVINFQGADIDNNGQLKGNSIIGTAKSIKNDIMGKIKGGVIDLISKNNIDNLGSIKGNRFISLTSMDGNVSNRAIIKNNRLGNDSIVSIGSISSDGDMMLKGNKVLIDGSTIDAAGSLGVDSTEFKISTVILNKSQGDDDDSENYKLKIWQDLVKSQVDVGDRLIINTKEGLTVIGSDISVNNGTYASIGGDISIISQEKKETSRYKKTTRRHDFVVTTVDVETGHHKSIKQVKSQVKLGERSVIDVKKEVLIAGSDVHGGQININANDGVYVMSLHDTEILHRTYVDDDFLSKSKLFIETVKQDVVKGGLIANQLKIRVNNGDVMVMGSDVSASNGMEINAKDGISFISDKKVNKTRHKKSSSVFFDFNKGFLYKQQDNDVQIKEGIVGSDVASGRNLDLVSEGSIKKVGGSLTVIGDAKISADSIMFLTARAKNYHEKESKKSSFSSMGLDLSLSQLSAGISVHSHINESKTVESETVFDAGINQIGGNLQLSAKQSIGIAGTDILVGKNTQIEADNLNVLAAEGMKLIEKTEGDLNQSTRFGVGNAWVDAVNSGLKGAKLVQEIARSAVTAGSLGFYLSLQTRLSGSKITSKKETSTNQSGGVYTKEDVSIMVDKLQIKGSDLVSHQGDITVVAPDISIESSMDTQRGAIKTEHVSYANELMSSSEAIVGGTLEKRQQQSRWLSKAHRNSKIQGDKVRISSKKTDIVGGNIVGRVIDVNSDELNIQSQLNTSIYNQDGEGYSVGNRGGINKGDTKADRAWVGHVSGIQGSDGVNIQSKQIILDGSVISQVSNSGENGSNLTISTDRLTEKSIIEYDMLVSDKYGLSGDSETIGLAYGDVNIDMPSRYVTDTGAAFSEDLDAVTGLPGNAFQAVENVVKAGENLGVSFAENLVGKGKDGVFEDYQGKVRNQELGLQVKRDKELRQAVIQLRTNPEEAEKSLEGLAKRALQANGINQDVDIVLYDSDTMTDKQSAAVDVLGIPVKKDNMAAFYDKETKKIYINVAVSNDEKQDVVSSLANELSHVVDDNRGREFDIRRQLISTAYEEDASHQIEGYNNGKYIPYLNKKKLGKGNVGDYFLFGNHEAGGVINPEPDIFLGGKDSKYTRIPFPGDDVDVHAGIEGSFGATNGSLGTDGKSVGVTSPDFSGGAYVEIMPRGEDINSKVMFSVGRYFDVGIAKTKENKLGVGLSVGLGLKRLSKRFPLNPPVTAEYSADIEDLRQ